jgi:hypothetical protein
MRSLGLFIGTFGGGRNVNQKLEDPHPVPRYPDCQYCGDAGLDGYELIDRASPTAQGREHIIEGVIGTVPRGPSEDFEQ